jgi:NMD protein affecting ribosome stability and mRNA decay
MGLCPDCRKKAETEIIIKMLTKKICDKCGKEYLG